MVKDEGVALAGDVLITEPNLPKSLETMALGSDPPHSAVQETAGEAITDQDMPLGDVDGDGSDSDDDATDRYRLTTNPETVPNVSTLRRRGDAVFHQWVQKSQRLGTKLFVDKRTHDLDRTSTARMIQSNEKGIISTPREYQIELFERAKDKNLIIVLDTGAGKTLIAALLLRHTLDQELERRAQGESKKVAFFLVEKVALCIQQYSVLKANLEHPIDKFHGEMAGIMRTKAFWDKRFSESMVIVCTAQILLDCLNSGFIQMQQINLLIFDEAHHTKKKHPYARIIKDHYLREPANRPRILGMTASPVDAQTSDLRAAALELEGILCSQIATVSDEALARGLAQRNQVELKEYYARLVNAEDARTPLCQKLSELMSHDTHYRIHFDAAQDVASTLGPWCADKYWELLMTDDEVRRRVAKAQGDVSSLHAPIGTTEADRVLATLQEAQKAIREAATANAASEPARGSATFSSKVELLRQILRDSFSRERTGRCIVFVQKRHTALLLSIFFSQAGKHVPGMRSSYLIGSQPLTASIANMSFRDQVLTLQRFRRGEFNCLFATQVAEEGLDIPECDLVIRFDLYDSAIQYIQSKGRARQANSTYISMLEEGNMRHLRRLKQATRDANALRRFVSGLPADRKIQDTFDVETLAEHERITQKFYEIPETGARLTFSSSQEVLAKFVSSLGGPDVSLSPEYVVTPSHTSRKFVATIIFPDTSPFKSMKGFAQRNKQLARCSAAFEACVELIKKKYINSHLQPTLGKMLPAMRNARLALSSNKRHEYNMRIKPGMWSGLGSDLPTQLFHSVFVLDSPEAVQWPTSPIIFLTRQKLPDIEPMLLFLDQGRTSVARLVSSSRPLRLSLDELHDLVTFTLAIFSDVFSKDYNAQPADMPYFLAPCARIPMDDGTASADPTRIDWETVTKVSHSEQPDWRGAPEDFFHDKLVMDPWDGSRKFIIHGINKALRPSDPVPEGAPMPKSRAYRQVEPNIKEYSNSLTIHSRRRQTWDENQPVVDATLLPIRRNFLDEYTAEDNQELRCCIILEPMRVSKLPIDMVSMAMIIPVMIYRLDSVLIALEACKLLDLDIQPNLALEALTKDSSNTEEHGDVQVDFQVGMGNNYERLEFLGDAFLKMATTISLFTLIPNTNEFEYHVERMLLVCNQNLFNHAVDRKLQEYVRSKPFDRRTWYPDLKLKRGKMPKTGGHFHNLSDKSVADVCEALIGAAYVSQRESGKMDLAVKAVTKMVRSKNHKMLKFSDYYDAFRVPDWQNAPASAVQRLAVDQISEATGYRFKCPNLLRSSFKHPSYPYEPIPNYQRLEFLGDALLDLVIVDYLFRRFPDADPQWLTEHKMAMVSNHFFGSLCVQLGLQKHLLMTTSSLIGQISDYVAELEMARELARPEEGPGNTKAEGRKDYWLSTSQPPKILSDMLEALVGAMFVDSRYDYSVVEGFFTSFIEPYFEDMALYDTYASRHPVTALAQMLQNQLGCQNWRLYVSVVPCGPDQGATAVTGDDAVCALMVHDKVVEHDTAKVGRDAKLAVAKMALRRFDGMEKEAFQREMGCDCRAEGNEGAQASGAQ